MTTKISLEQFAKKLEDHTTKDLIEMLYNRMSDDDLIELAAEEDCQEEHEEEEWEKREKCPCGLTLSDDDMALEKVHDVRLCEGCFEENKKDHEPPEPDGDGSGDE